MGYEIEHLIDGNQTFTYGGFYKLEDAVNKAISNRSKYPNINIVYYGYNGDMERMSLDEAITKVEIKNKVMQGTRRFSK